MTGQGSFIPLKNEQEVFIVGDIHGCLNTFTALLDTINYKGKSPLFLLGDYVNKGPRSKETMDYLIELKKSFPKVFPLPGNHDSYLLSFLTRTDPDWLQSGQHALMLKNGAFTNITASQKAGYINFLNSLPLYYETEEAYMVHAGFNFESDNIFDDTWSMLNIRQFKYNPHKVGGKKLIHGHMPVSFEEIKQAVEGNFAVLPLDNGCVYDGEREDMGNLCCLELKEMKLFAHPKTD